MIANRWQVAVSVRRMRDGLSARNKGIADFSNDWLVVAGCVGVIDPAHDQRVLFFQQLAEQLLLCGI